MDIENIFKPMKSDEIHAKHALCAGLSQEHKLLVGLMVGTVLGSDVFHQHTMRKRNDIDYAHAESAEIISMAALTAFVRITEGLIENADGIAGVMRHAPAIQMLIEQLEADHPEATVEEVQTRATEQIMAIINCVVDFTTH